MSVTRRRHELSQTHCESLQPVYAIHILTCPSAGVTRRTRAPHTPSNVGTNAEGTLLRSFIGYDNNI
jgi:hypothetical protein